MTRAKTICLDSMSPSLKDPEVRVQYYKPDPESMVNEVLARLNEALVQSDGAVYANPLVTVSCIEPTEEFFTVVRKQQGTWCKRFNAQYSRRTTRHVRNWYSDEGPTTKQHRFFTRAFCFTGVLFICGVYTPPNQWPDLMSQKRKFQKAR